jgi:hypothetical protein
MLQRLADAGLVESKTIGVDATTPEAIVGTAFWRCVSECGAACHRAARLERQASPLLDEAGAWLGYPNANTCRPCAERSEAEEEGANDDWKHPNDPDAKI